MKKKLALILVVALLISLLPIDMLQMTVKAGTSGVFTYVVANGEVTITDCDTSATGELVIPETLDGYPVTSIMNSAFSGCGSLISIELPSGLTSIGDSVFSYCESLTSIELPSGVTSIGDYAFERCESLISIEIPSGITNIGNHAFYCCRGLTDIILPSGLSNIGNSAFEDCKSLTSIELPAELTSIGDRAFYGCDSLAGIELPPRLTSIGEYTFANCYSLTSIEIPSGVTSIGDFALAGCTRLINIVVEEGNSTYYSEGNCLIETASNALLAGCRNSIIPLGVTSIKDGAFQDCDGLISIKLPAGVTSIGNGAFMSCSGLTSIELPAGLTSIGDGAFFDCPGLISIEIPERVINIGDTAFYWCDRLTDIILPTGLSNIGNSAFENCYSMTNVWYTGTEEQANGITIDEDNECLTSATWHYDICEEKHIYTDCYDLSCENCEWIRKSAHDIVVIRRVEATCTQEGNIAYWTCNDCGKSFRDELCTEEILLEDTVIPSTGHTEKILPVKEATTTSTGLTEGKVCSVCGDVLVEQKVIDKLVVKPDASQTESKKNPQVTKPKASKLTKVTGGKKKITVKFKKISGIDGYEIQVALKKNFKSGKKTYNVKASKKSYVAKKLKGGKKYFVRIRTYKKVNGENVYSKWSTAKKVKTKK